MGDLNYGYFNDKYPTKEAKRRMALALLLPDTPAAPPITLSERTAAQQHATYASRPALALLWGENPADHHRIAKYYATLGHTADLRRGETVMLFNGLDPHLVAAKRAELPDAGFSIDIARLQNLPSVGNVNHRFARARPEIAPKRGVAGARIINLHTELVTLPVQRLSVDALGQVKVTDTGARHLEVHNASVSLEENEELYHRTRHIHTREEVVFGNPQSFRLFRQTVSLIGEDYKEAVDQAVETADILPFTTLPDLTFLNDVVPPCYEDESVMNSVLDIDALLDENSVFMRQHSA